MAQAVHPSHAQAVAAEEVEDQAGVAVAEDHQTLVPPAGGHLDELPVCGRAGDLEAGRAPGHPCL